MPSPTYHYVNTETRLFVNPLDCEIPSPEHPCLPVTGSSILSLKLLQPNGHPYPLSDRSAVSAGITMDGVLVFTAIGRNTDLVDGLDGVVFLNLEPVKGAVLSTGTAQISVLVDGAFVLNDSVSLVGAPVPNPIGCGCPDAPKMTNLGVIEEYIAPSEEMTGQYVLYLGATGQLIRGCIYKCELVDGTYAWVPKTDPADDNLRLIEWQP